MIVNPDVDSYAKTLNHRKMTTKRMLKPKYHLRWRSGFHI